MRRTRREKWLRDDRVLHNLHTVLIKQHFSVKNNMTVVPHLTYLPNLTLCDFFVVSKLTIKLKERRFDKIKQIGENLEYVNKTRLPECTTLVPKVLESVFANPKELL